MFRKSSICLRLKSIVRLEVFAEDYLPETIIDREKEKMALKEYLESILRGRKRAFYIHGPPGVGKTVVTKHVLNQFEDSCNSEVVYINSESSTPNHALREIYNALGGDVERRVPSSSLISGIFKKRIEKDFTLVIALDNFDKMEHVDDLLWKIYAIAPKIPGLGLILISTSKTNLISLIGRRLYDRLSPEIYEFKPYNANELFEIISQRIREAYGKQIAEDEALWKLAESIAKNGGNVRRLFSLFLDALDLAQRKMMKKVDVEIMEEIIQKKN